MVEIRPFARRDREQLARLVNAHVAVAFPGGYVPAATLLNDLEHPLGEYIIGPWVTDGATIVGIERDRVVAAAHVRLYADDDRVSPGYKHAGEIVWLLCWPEHGDAGRAVRDAAVAQLEAWRTRVHYAGGTLPCPGVYGVSDGWPHVQRIYADGGFTPAGGQVEIVLAGSLASIPPAGEAPIPGLSLHRQLGSLGTTFNAILDGEVVGLFEVDDDLTSGGTNLAASGWADTCNHRVREDLRRRGIGTWLIRSAAEWLRLGGTTRLLAYVIEDERAGECVRYYGRHGLQPINRTVRGWSRPA